jgi:hypothetical protein
MNEFTQEKWSYGNRDRIIDRNEEKAREDEIGEEGWEKIVGKREKIDSKGEISEEEKRERRGQEERENKKKR